MISALWFCFLFLPSGTLDSKLLLFSDVTRISRPRGALHDGEYENTQAKIELTKLKAREQIINLNDNLDNRTSSNCRTVHPIQAAMMLVDRTLRLQVDVVVFYYLPSYFFKLS